MCAAAIRSVARCQWPCSCTTGSSQLGTGPIRIRDIQLILQKMYPQIDVAGETDGEFVDRAMAGDTALARELLGMEFHSLEDTLRATVVSPSSVTSNLRQLDVVEQLCPQLCHHRPVFWACRYVHVLAYPVYITIISRVSVQLDAQWW